MADEIAKSIPCAPWQLQMRDFDFIRQLVGVFAYDREPIGGQIPLIPVIDKRLEWQTSQPTFKVADHPEDGFQALDVASGALH